LGKSLQKDGRNKKKTLKVMTATNKTYINFKLSKNKNFEFEADFGYCKWNNLLSFSINWETNYFEHYKTPVIHFDLFKFVSVYFSIYDTRELD
jgi:hypothetical protein